jgi:chemotaxis protein MotB
VKDGQVRITQNSLGITVEINASVLFSPGQAKLAESSSLTLQAVAYVIKGHEHEIHVEGHTDNLPIHTESFPSNWELSAARASSVIRLFVENGVEAHRLTAIGYGENRPLETNETPEGRKRNRRVTIMILSTNPDKVTEIPIVEY